VNYTLGRKKKIGCAELKRGRLSTRQEGAECRIKRQSSQSITSSQTATATEGGGKKGGSNLKAGTMRVGMSQFREEKEEMFGIQAVAQDEEAVNRAKRRRWWGLKGSMKWLPGEEKSMMVKVRNDGGE